MEVLILIMLRGYKGKKGKELEKKGNIFSGNYIIPSQRNKGENLSKPKADFILIKIMLKDKAASQTKWLNQCFDL